MLLWSGSKWHRSVRELVRKRGCLVLEWREEGRCWRARGPFRAPARSRATLRSPMLDLKAKLASAGLVSKEDIARAEQAKAKAKSKRKGKGKGRGKSKGPAAKGGVRRLNVAALEGAPKNELYDAVRRWVDKARLDARGMPTESSKAFHFAEVTGRVGRLMLEPALAKEIEQSRAAVVAYMSNSGLAHAVVPAAGAADIASLNEEWLRVLPSDSRAGKIVKP